MKEMTTYKRADGELILDEFGWVADIEYFDDDDEPTQLIEERWQLVSTRKMWAGGTNCWQCHDHVDLPEDYKNGPVLHEGACRTEWDEEMAES